MTLSLDHSSILIPLADPATNDVPFGRSQVIVLGDKTFGVMVSMQSQADHSVWTVRFYHLDRDLSVLGFIEESTSLDASGTAMVRTSATTALGIFTESVSFASRECETWDVDFSADTPVVTRHQGPMDGGIVVNDYRFGISNSYFPDDDLAVFQERLTASFVDGAFNQEVSFSGSAYPTYMWQPTTGDPRRWIALDAQPDFGSSVYNCFLWEVTVDSSGTVGSVFLEQIDIAFTSPDQQTIVNIVGYETGVMRVIERRHEGDGDEHGWELVEYNPSRTVLSSTDEDPLPQYLALQPDIQFDAAGSAMVAYGAGPEWGDTSDWGAGTLHPGYEHGLLWLDAATSTLSQLTLPRPLDGGIGEVDELFGRSTTVDMLDGVWVAASTGVTLFESPDLYGTAIWCGRYGGVSWVRNIQRNDGLGVSSHRWGSNVSVNLRVVGITFSGLGSNQSIRWRGTR